MSPNPKTQTKLVRIPNPSNQCGDEVTVNMERWFYITDNGRIILLKGIFNDQKELENALRKCDLPDNSKEKEDCPEHFIIYAKPLELVKFAREILNLYTGYENVV